MAKANAGWHHLKLRTTTNPLMLLRFGTGIQIGQLEAVMELLAINPDKTTSSFCLNLENCANLMIERPSVLYGIAMCYVEFAVF